MSKPAAKAPEPSMEEILASIRRIISDENSAAQPAAAAAAPAPAAAPAAPAPKPAAPPPAAKKAAPPPPPPPPPPAAEQEEADVLELTEMVEAPQDEFQKAEAVADVMFRDPEPLRDVMNEPSRMSAPARIDDGLLSQNTSSAVSAAFERIASPMFSGDSRTVDELVREMLRPMLKAWLDDNLPSLVERLVRSEIERVSRGR
jgi:cell pole-organizing protein PopZ